MPRVATFSAVPKTMTAKRLVGGGGDGEMVAERVAQMACPPVETTDGAPGCTLRHTRATERAARCTVRRLD